MSVIASPPIKKLVVIEDGILVTMANSPQFLTEFPFLKSLATYRAPAGGCGSCGGKNNGQKAVVFTAAKQAIAGMGDDKKRTLKRLLNTELVRITYRNGEKVIQHNF